MRLRQREHALVAAALLLVTLLSSWTIDRARRDYASNAKLTPATSAVAFAVYSLNAALTIVAAARARWPLPISRVIRLGVGIPLVFFGLVLYGSGLTTLRSPRAVVGLEANELITTGVYQWSRNPQLVGWGCFLVGVALLGRSGGALGYAVLFWGTSVAYLPVEERFLATAYGDDYRRYRLVTSRFFGLPRRSVQQRTAR